MQEEEEIWKDIYFEEYGVVWDFRNMYQISNYGTIRSLDRIVIERNGKKHFIKGRILKKTKGKHGYNYVTLCDKFKFKKRFRVARLVGHMFIDGYLDNMVIDHINAVRDDDRSNNLRWCTQRENILNPITLNKKKIASSGEKHPLYGKKGKDNPKYNKGGRKIVQLDKNMSYIKTWNCFANIERELNINKGNVVQCCRGKYKTAGNYIWMYEENYNLWKQLNEYYKFDNERGNKYE